MSFVQSLDANVEPLEKKYITNYYCDLEFNTNYYYETDFIICKDNDNFKNLIELLCIDDDKLLDSFEDKDDCDIKVIKKIKAKVNALDIIINQTPDNDGYIKDNFNCIWNRTLIINENFARYPDFLNELLKKYRYVIILDVNFTVPELPNNILYVSVDLLQSQYSFIQRVTNQINQKVFNDIISNRILPSNLIYLDLVTDRTILPDISIVPQIIILRLMGFQYTRQLCNLPESLIYLRSDSYTNYINVITNFHNNLMILDIGYTYGSNDISYYIKEWPQNLIEYIDNNENSVLTIATKPPSSLESFVFKGEIDAEDFNKLGDGLKSILIQCELIGEVTISKNLKKLNLCETGLIDLKILPPSVEEISLEADFIFVEYSKNPNGVLPKGLKKVNLSYFCDPDERQYERILNEYKYGQVVKTYSCSEIRKLPNIGKYVLKYSTCPSERCFKCYEIDETESDYYGTYYDSDDKESDVQNSKRSRLTKSSHYHINTYEWIIDFTNILEKNGTIVETFEARR
jgi:hypothetical protein